MYIKRNHIFFCFNSKHSINYKDHVGPPLPINMCQYTDEWNKDFVKLPFSDKNRDENNEVGLFKAKIRYNNKG